MNEPNSAEHATPNEFLQACEIARREAVYVRPGAMACKRVALRDFVLLLAKIGVWVAVFAMDSVTLLQGVIAFLALVVLTRFSKAIFVGELLQIWRAREAMGTSPLWEQTLASKPKLREVERGMDRNYEAVKAWRWWREPKVTGESEGRRA